MVSLGRRTIPIDRYRYEDNGQHRLTLTMTLDLEIKDYLGSMTTNKHRLKVGSTLSDENRSPGCCPRSYETRVFLVRYSATR